MDTYSTLEVSHEQSPLHAAAITQTQQDYERFPEALPVEAKQKVDDIPEVDHTHKRFVSDEAQAPEALPNQFPYGGTGGDRTAPEWLSADEVDLEQAQRKEQRICGIKRRTFFILLPFATLIIIAALAGGLAGGLTHRSSLSSGDQTVAAGDVNIMDVSSLAASNWTDGKGFNHRIVFFQDPWNAIVARRWDSQNKTWATTNITSATANSATPVMPAPGTSLASAALDWPGAYDVHLYFLDPWDVVRSTYSDSPVQLTDLWKNDTLGSSNIKVLHGSKLAATWARSSTPNDVGLWTLAWQDPNGGFIKVANYSNYKASVNGVDGNKVAANTSLALLPQYGGAQNNLGLISQSFTSGTAGDLQASLWNQTWKNRECCTPLYSFICDVRKAGGSKGADH
jgi:hypothetical protein